MEDTVSQVRQPSITTEPKQPSVIITRASLHNESSLQGTSTESRSPSIQPGPIATKASLQSAAKLVLPGAETGARISLKNSIRSNPTLERTSTQSSKHSLPHKLLSISSPVNIESAIIKKIIPLLTQHYISPNLISPKKISNTSVEQGILKAEQVEENLKAAVSSLEPQGKSISDHVEELTDTVGKLKKVFDDPNSPAANSNIDKIANMSKILTNEANALRESIKSLSVDIAMTKREISNRTEENVNFPYHLFLVEIIINKIHMKCDCFEIDYNNLVISASFLGKQPIVLYNSSYGKIDNFAKLNVGKSTLFAMTYDKICSIKEFEIVLQLTKEPPCSSCVTKIAETRMDYTKEFLKLREELCNKWRQEKPEDNILCTTSTPLTKNMFYLACGEECSPESIGVIEATVRMSFLGKEITTAFSMSPKPRGTSTLLKEDNGMTMYSCQKVEMDDQGKILLDEDVLTKKNIPCSTLPTRGTDSPLSRYSTPPTSRPSSIRSKGPGFPRYDEIFTKVNDNELKIRVPKSTRLDRTAKYDRVQELCDCESNTYNAGQQIQFEMPRELCYPDKTHNYYSSNLTYTYKGCDKTCESKDRKIINVTPANCPVPVNMEKEVHPQKDIFILKIGKKLETKDKKTDLEIQLVTPKPPPAKPVENNNAALQCNSSGVKLKSSKKDKVKGKKKGKGKGKKSKSKTSLGKKSTIGKQKGKKSKQ